MLKMQKVGKLEIICGSMFSGKSEELIRRVRRANYARQKIQLFKHIHDCRKTIEHIHAHSGDKIPACAAPSVEYIESMILDDTEIVGIDEIQFFDHSIILLIDKLVAQGKRVILAGLDLDFRGIPFGPMPILLALADDVVKLKAVCVKSGLDAHFTQRLVNGRPALHTDPIVVIGAEETYEARSRHCYEIDKKPLKEYIEQNKA